MMKVDIAHHKSNIKRNRCIDGEKDIITTNYKSMRGDYYLWKN